MKIIATQGKNRFLVQTGPDLGKRTAGAVVSFEGREEGEAWALPVHSVLARGYWVEPGEIEPDLRDRILELAGRAPAVTA